MNGDFSLWPVAASEYASQVDMLMLAFLGVLVLLVGPVAVLLVVFTVRYRRGAEASRIPPATRNLRLEFSWALVPFAIALGFFGWSSVLYLDGREPPEGALEIAVLARQWMWEVQHPAGPRELNALHVPAGRPVRLRMISEDVIHSLYLPALRLKHDVLPGRYTELWFVADRTGEYDLRCAEFCGTGHPIMDGRLVVMTPEAYGNWLERSEADPALAERGEALFRRFGCSGCHGPAAAVRAPRLDGLYRSPVPLADGTIVIADENYLRDSILTPDRQVAAGYEPVMPSFANHLREGELVALLAFLRALGTAGEEVASP